MYSGSFRRLRRDFFRLLGAFAGVFVAGIAAADPNPARP